MIRFLRCTLFPAGILGLFLSMMVGAMADSVTFTGNVVVSSADNVIRGETLVLQVGTGRTLLSPAAKPGERVQGVIHLKQGPTKEEKKQPVVATAGC